MRGCRTTTRCWPLGYVKQREPFGQPVARFQGVQFTLADMAMKLEGARQLTYNAAALYEQATRGGKVPGLTFTSAAAKCLASDTAMQVTTDAVQLLGGYGYVHDYPVERMMRDAKITLIYEGTNQIQRLVRARQLLRQRPSWIFGSNIPGKARAGHFYLTTLADQKLTNMEGDMAKLQPQDLTFADTATLRIDARFDSPAPPSAVFAVLADHRGAIEWIGSGVSKIEPTSTPEEGVGATRTVWFFGGLGRLDETFIAWDEPTVWSFTGTAFRPGVFTKFVERVSLEPSQSDGCRIIYRLALETRPAIRLLDGIIRRVLAWQAPRVLASLSSAASRRHPAEDWQR